MDYLEKMLNINEISGRAYDVTIVPAGQYLRRFRRFFFIDFGEDNFLMKPQFGLFSREYLRYAESTAAGPYPKLTVSQIVEQGHL